MFGVPPLIAQSSSNPAMMRALFWIGLMIGAVIVGGAAILAIRRRLFDAPSERTGGPPLTLHEARKLRDDGEIGDEEFERLRALIIGEVVATPHPDVAELKAARDRHDAEQSADEPSDGGFGDLGDSSD